MVREQKTTAGVPVAEVTAGPKVLFTLNERRVLLGKALGQRSSDIAESLGMGEKTVYTLTNDISEKYREGINKGSGLLGAVVYAAVTDQIDLSEVTLVDSTTTPEQRINPSVLERLTPADHKLLQAMLTLGDSNQDRLARYIGGISRSTVSSRLTEVRKKFVAGFEAQLANRLQTDVSAVATYLALQLQRNPDFLTNLLQNPQMLGDEVPLRRARAAEREEQSVFVRPDSRRTKKAAIEAMSTPRTGIGVIYGEHAPGEGMAEIKDPRILLAAQNMEELREDLERRGMQRELELLNALAERFPLATIHEREGGNRVLQIGKEGAALEEGSPKVVFIHGGLMFEAERRLIAQISASK